MSESEFTVVLRVRIRPARAEDLDALEWFGLSACARRELGESLVLVAESGGSPVGQVRIDLASSGEGAWTGSLRELSVLPWLIGLGIGRRLVLAAEEALAVRGATRVRAGAEKTNVRARALLERLGFRVTGDLQESCSYTARGGEQVDATVDQWILEKDLARP